MVSSDIHQSSELRACSVLRYFDSGHAVAIMGYGLDRVIAFDIHDDVRKPNDLS